MTESQQRRMVAMLACLVYDDGPSWRALLKAPSERTFLEFWLTWRSEAENLLKEIESGVDRPPTNVFRKPAKRS